MKIRFTTNAGIRIGFLSINKGDIANVGLTPAEEGKKTLRIDNYRLPPDEKLLRVSGILVGKTGTEAEISIEVIPPTKFKKPLIYKDSYFFSNGGKCVFVAKIKLELLQKDGGFQGNRISE